jgi:hypothetical protein
MLADNDAGIKSVYFNFSDDGCSFTLKRDNQLQTIKAGYGKWKVTNSQLTSLTGPQRSAPSKSVDANYTVPQSAVKAGTMYNWTDPNTLEISARFIENELGSQTIVCAFSGFGDSFAVNIYPKEPSIGAVRPGGMVQSQAGLRGTMVELK